ncbi:MAG: hypothetical protein K5905_26595 [Roseibium sp.]|uniref:hypothetical protein n=1 Tax=Roseibium sp. TaxID=1936156 RepID=UPI0026151628|nr:hypothetical protein [Roseibium sp.]MCV0429040.1 hypothetical protein [Roseibium sp.]
MNLFPTSWPELDRQTIIGVSPWAIFIAASAMFQYLVNPLYTSFDRTIDGLETKTIYARQTGGKICVGDMVTFRAADTGTRYIRRIAAGEGQLFSVSPQGYLIDDVAFLADAKWLEVARKQLGNERSIVLPKDHYLIVNSEFGWDRVGGEWAYAVVSSANILNRVTYVLVSRDLSRIGDRLNSDGSGC